METTVIKLSYMKEAKPTKKDAIQDHHTSQIVKTTKVQLVSQPTKEDATQDHHTSQIVKKDTQLVSQPTKEDATQDHHTSQIVKQDSQERTHTHIPQLKLLQLPLLPLEHGYQLLLRRPMRLLSQPLNSIQLDHGLFQPWKTGLPFKNPVSLIQADHSPRNTDMSHTSSCEISMILLSMLSDQVVLRPL